MVAVCAVAGEAGLQRSVQEGVGRMIGGGGVMPGLHVAVCVRRIEVAAAAVAAAGAIGVAAVATAAERVMRLSMHQAVRVLAPEAVHAPQ